MYEVWQKSPAQTTGGERGIRTPDTRKGIHAFEARAFSHSAISPRSPVSIFILSGKLPASNFRIPLIELSPAQVCDSRGCKSQQRHLISLLLLLFLLELPCWSAQQYRS